MYIGKSCDVKSRWQDHQLRARSGSRYFLHRALRAHPASEFDWWVVQVCASDAEACVVEMDWIARLRMSDVSLFNLTDGGDGTAGRPCSEETRRKLAEAQRGRRLSEETRRKMSESRTNPSETTRSRMSAARKGKKHPADVRKKIRDAHANKTPAEREAWIRRISEAKRTKRLSRGFDGR